MTDTRTRRRRPGIIWVNVLAALNIIWVIVGLALATGGRETQLIGIIMVPHIYSFVLGWPLLLWLLIIGVVWAYANARGKPDQVGWKFWKYGTLVLSASLLAGPAVFGLAVLTGIYVF